VAEWSRNNRACSTTWTTLFVLEQSTLPFAESGGVPMHALAFWDDAASDDLRRLQAQALAIEMDNVFRLIRGARYEEGADTGTAVRAMCEVLTSRDRTMSDLAAANDANYRFWREGSV